MYKTRNYPLLTASVRSYCCQGCVFAVLSSDDVTKKGRNSEARLFEMVYTYLKFHINPPYIAFVINCILTHTFFFPLVYLGGYNINILYICSNLKRKNYVSARIVFLLKFIYYEHCVFYVLFLDFTQMHYCCNTFSVLCPSVFHFSHFRLFL